MQIFNNAINPKDEALQTELMPARSAGVKKVVARKNKDGIGGLTVLSSGTVYIPTGDTPYERNIRYHEGLHAEHTSRKFQPKDLLDQALEDARLHRYCSKSVGSIYPQAREDEVTVAMEELTAMAAMPKLDATHSLATLRAMAILEAGTVAPEHKAMLDAVLARLGEKSTKDFARALSLLSDVKNWNKARGVLAPYFAKDFEDKPKDEGKGESGKESEDKGFGIGESEEPKSEDKPESEDKEESESESEDSKDSASEDSLESESESDSRPSADFAPEDIAPVLKPSLPRPKEETNPDEYTAKLAPACDKGTFERMQEKHPLKLIIRRMDMGTNRVKLSMGRRAPLPVISGHKILARKLAGALINPGMRVFARSVAQGGAGTVLIDASGSMSIPESVLIAFLAKAPALTLAFYNAPDDNRRTDHGNIYIYAANGYRANAPSIRAAAPEYGTGNLIDYHAICWLLKQPSPHYLVTDSGYTGAWSAAAYRLENKLVASKDLIVVRGLDEMTKILESLE